LYDANRLDVINLQGFSLVEADRARQQRLDDFVSFPWLAIEYLGFDCSQPPFNDPLVRRAFGMSIDLETLAEVVMKGYHAPGLGGFIPPGIPGHSPGIGLPYDPEHARQLLAQAGYPLGRGFPRLLTLTMLQEGEPSHRYLQDQWREILGVEVIWEVSPTGLSTLLEEQPLPIFIATWLADYPDPDNFLRVCPICRWTRWHNDAFADLVDKARRVANQAERMRIYQRADRMLIEEAVVLPLFYDRLNMLMKPWVRNFPVSPLSIWYWEDVILAPH
jgi:oligopeptide transport system substrate-binding protein